MTAIPPTVPDPQTTRPSVAVIAVSHTEVILNQIGSKAVAVIACGFFGHLCWLEAKSAMPSNVRLALVAVPTFFCVAMLSTDAFVATIKAVGSALAPYLPAKFGGKS